MSFLGCDFQESNEVTRSIPDIVDGHDVTIDLIEDVAANPNSDKYSTMTENEKQNLLKINDKLKEIFSKYPVVYAGVHNLCGCISNIGRNARLTQA